MTSRVLVTHGGERGGTAEIAERIATVLREQGLAVDRMPARKVRDLRPYGAVVVGGALHALRWHADARRFVLRHAEALRARDVFFFSSGPLVRSASEDEIAPVSQVEQLMGYVGARGHAAFGGRLAEDAAGLAAGARAEDPSDFSQIDAWAREVAVGIRKPSSPRLVPTRLPSRALPLVLCALTGAAALTGGVALAFSRGAVLLGVRTLHAPIVLAVIALLVAALHLGAAWLHVVRSDYAALASGVAGGALVLATSAAMLALGAVTLVELVALAIGVVLLGDAASRLRATFIEWSRVERARTA